MEGKNKKTKVFKWAAALMLAASVIGCKHNVSNTPETFTVTFSVESGNGTLKAKADGITETETSPITVEQGKTVTFTAEPNGGYEVDKWTITGGAFETGTGTGGSTTAKVKITATVNITVSFKALPPVQKYTVTLMQSEHGSVTAEPAIPSDNQIAKDTEITFTAQANAGYQINTWSITGDVLQSGGKSGNISAKVKITANTTVQVTFKPIEYASVPYAGLDTYLKDSALEANINYIKVTGLTAEALKGEAGYPSSEPSPLGKILKANETKKVALKFDGSIAGLTDMRACFSGCTNLTQAPDIPASVTYMSSCFSGCTSLTQAPDIPASVTNMSWCFSHCTKLISVTLKCNYNNDTDADGTHHFKNTFIRCSSLKQSTIKVPVGQFETYKANAGIMGTTADRFAKDE